MQKVSFTVRDKDVVAFGTAFFESGDTYQRAVVRQHPIHVYYEYPPSKNVDILPLLELRIMFPQTKVTVIPDFANNDEHFYSQLIIEHIEHFLKNTSPGLTHDIQAFKISEFCCHRHDIFYLWYKPGHEPNGVDMTLDREGEPFATEICRMLGLEDIYSIYCDIAFDGIDVRYSKNSSCRRVEDVEKGLR